MNSLSDIGVEVNVASLFAKNKKRLSEGELENTFYGSFYSFSSFLCLLARPRLFLSTIRFLFTQTKTWSEAVKSFGATLPALAIANYIKDNNIGVAHCFWGHYPSLVVFFLRRIGYTGRCSVFTGAYDLVMRGGLMEWGVNNADIVFTHTKANVPVIRSFYDGEINVIYRGVNCLVSKDKFQANMLRKLADCSISLAFAGRLIRDKHPDICIELLRVIRSLGFESSLHIFGSGPEQKKLMRQVYEAGLESNVIFYGHVDQSSMFNIMESIGFFLFPSKHSSERLPNVVKEAMLLGCVPVVSNTPGIQELVIDGENGFISDFSDLQALALKLCNLMNTDQYAPLAVSATRKVLSDFNNRDLSAKRASLWFDREFK